MADIKTNIGALIQKKKELKKQFGKKRPLEKKRELNRLTAEHRTLLDSKEDYKTKIEQCKEQLTKCKGKEQKVHTLTLTCTLTYSRTHAHSHTHTRMHRRIEVGKSCKKA